MTKHLATLKKIIVALAVYLARCLNFYHFDIQNTEQMSQCRGVRVRCTCCGVRVDVCVFVCDVCVYVYDISASMHKCVFQLVHGAGMHRVWCPT